MYLDGKQQYFIGVVVLNIPRKTTFSAGWGDGSVPVLRGVPRAGS